MDASSVRAEVEREQALADLQRRMQERELELEKLKKDKLGLEQARDGERELILC